MKSRACFALILSLVLLGAFLPVRVGADEESATPSGLESGFSIDGWLALRAVTAYIDEQIRSVEHVLNTVAATEEAKSGTWERIQPLLKTLQGEGVPGILWFAHTDGSYYVADRGLVNANIADRPYFSKVMGGEVSVGELLVQVKGALGASLFLDTFNERILETLDLPEDMIFYVLDSNGITALHFMPRYLFQDPTTLNNPSLTQAVREIMRTNEGAVQYEFEGKPRRVIYTTSSYTGWHVMLGTVSGR
jgi:hypothetical protein